MRVTEGSDFGWPYCYYDQIKQKKVLAPEYGGDGEIIGRCADYEDPIIGFPGHWAPNDLVFMRAMHFLNIIETVRSLRFMDLPIGHPTHSRAISLALFRLKMAGLAENGKFLPMVSPG